MLEKFSVKKPFTILVCVLLVIALGVLSVKNMKTDLLPKTELPFLIIVSPYPGASPEKVESTLSGVIENEVATISGVKNVTTSNYENYAITRLEFNDGSDMNAAMVRTSHALQELEDKLPDGAMRPSLLEINMDMMATMYVAAGYENGDIYSVSDKVKNSIVPEIERIDGVATVNTVGLIEKSVQVDLDKDKVKALNDKILAATNAELSKAKALLDNAEGKIVEGQSQLDQNREAFGSKVSESIFGKIEGPVKSKAAEIRLQTEELASRLEALISAMEKADDVSLTDEQKTALNEAVEALRKAGANISDSDYESFLETVNDVIRAGAKTLVVLETVSDGIKSGAPKKALDEARKTLNELDDILKSVPDVLSGLKTGLAEMTQAQLDAAVGLSDVSAKLDDARRNLASARARYETARAAALKNANADQLLSLPTLSQIIYAQNFSMPAGYIDDKDDNSWLLKVGEPYESEKDIADALLVHIDKVGDVKLSDVANVSVIDNADDTYAKLNGKNSTILCIYKSPAAGTNEVSKACGEKLEELKENEDGFTYVTLVDQGSYITIIINGILHSMLIGVILAVIILAMFLRDIRPTFIVGISIPLSVMLALVLMYFSGLNINILTLSGLALGIGMLVDNSIVVMENIFRLRGLGLSAPRAAVQGAKQVRAAIISSTLTTICVFIPMAFTQGVVRQFLIPMAVSIGYCLGASLLIALTVIPTSASTVLRNIKPKKGKIYDKVLARYGRALDWCLNHKAIPIAVTVTLLALAVFGTVRSGSVLFPEVQATEIQANITAPEGTDPKDARKEADRIVNSISKIKTVENAGIMDMASSSGLMGSFSAGEGDKGSFICYISLDEDTERKEIIKTVKEIEKLSGKNGYKVTANAGNIEEVGGMMDVHDLTINVYGKDMDKILEYGDKVAKIVDDAGGFKNIVTEKEEGASTLNLVIDKDKVRSYGLTSAQIYAEIYGKLQESKVATTVTVNGEELEVVIKDRISPITKENLLDLEFDVPVAQEGISQMPEQAEQGNDMSSGMEGEMGKMDEETGGMGMNQNNGTGMPSGEVKTYKLGDFARLEETLSPTMINKENGSRYSIVTADTKDGYQTSLLVKKLEPKLKEYSDSLPDGYFVDIAGNTTLVRNMMHQMTLSILVAIIFIYLVMVAQFQSLLSPFIILFTLPLAFTGSMFALLASGQQFSLLSMMGFLILVGTVVNNGIVFVDYVNQLRIEGMDRRQALIATGKTRMRPILMTTLTTVLALFQMMFGRDVSNQLARGMALVVGGGLIYATVMTLFMIPIMYDILFKRKPLNIDIGDDIDSSYNDAASYRKNRDEEDNDGVEADDAKAVEKASVKKKERDN
jgi:multidrug efflux pump subunit AcrB